MAEHQQMMTPELLKSAKADVKQYSIDHEPIRWCQAHMDLAHQCVAEAFKSSGPTRVADKGIEHIEEALKVMTEKKHPRAFVSVHSWLARLYPKRVAGSRTENLTKALACAKTALRLWQQPPCPLAIVAELHELIGSIYEDEDFESSDSRAANDDLAIRHYLGFLQRCSMNDDKDNWVNAHRKVGLRYFKRKNGNQRSNTKVAIKHFAEVLKVITKSKHPDKWATIHKHLALAYDRLVRLSSMTKEVNNTQATLIEKWIASCEKALQVATPTHDAMGW
jgi:hypothetical protein